MTPFDLSALDALVRAYGLAHVVATLADVTSDRAYDEPCASPSAAAWSIDAETLRRTAAATVNRG